MHSKVGIFLCMINGKLEKGLERVMKCIKQSYITSYLLVARERHDREGGAKDYICIESQVSYKVEGLGFRCTVLRDIQCSVV